MRVLRTSDALYRRQVELRTFDVKRVLPEFFQAQYPNLIAFLEAYYDFLYNDEQHNFDQVINELYVIRDINATELTNLDQLFGEIGGGTTTSQYVNPRAAARLFALFFRRKGSIQATKMFFRTFYNADVDVHYPKYDILTVGIHRIGPEFGKRIQDYRLYQIFSILITAPIPISQWRELYRLFAHPAGFYFGGQVLLEGIACLFEDSAGGVLQPTAIPTEANPQFAEIASFSFSGSMTEIIGILPDGSDSDALPTLVRLDKTIGQLDSDTLATLDTLYDDTSTYLNVNSPTMDEDSDGVAKPIRLSNNLETMDEDLWLARDDPAYK